MGTLTTIRLQFDLDLSAVQRPFDWLSKVIKVGVRLPTSHSHGDIFIYLGRSVADSSVV